MGPGSIIDDANRREIFNPTSYEFKKAELFFREDLSGWRKALVIIATIAAAIFFVFAAFPVFCLAVKALLPPDPDAVQRLENGQLPDNLTLYQQVYLAKQQDRFNVYPNTWKTGSIGTKEKEQTLRAFEQKSIVQANALRNRLDVYFMGNPTDEDNRMLPIVRDYLQTLHGVDVVFKERLELVENDSRIIDGKKQYSVENQLGKLINIPHENNYIIGFMNEDMYPKGLNYVFGGGFANYASGLFSVNRLSQDFNTTLVRLLILASHEFGHMRGMGHCSRHLCNMLGTNNINELDAEPLTYCAQDMAKICSLNHWSLKQGYAQHLKFFENFQEKYGIAIDFSKEISHLERKILALT